MIILDQDLFFMEDVLSISLKLRPLTTSDEDGLRIGLSRIPELPWKVPQNDGCSQNRNPRTENTISVRSPFLLLRRPLINSTHYKFYSSFKVQNFEKWRQSSPVAPYSFYKHYFNICVSPYTTFLRKIYIQFKPTLTPVLSAVERSGGAQKLGPGTNCSDRL